MTQRLALGLLVVAVGVAWLLTEIGALPLTYRTAIGALLVAIGLAVVLVVDRRWLLVTLGVLVALAGVPALVVPGDVFQGGVGDRLERPADRQDLEPFRHAIGMLTVDLTTPGLDLDDARIEATLGIGELLVLVTEDTDVSLDLHVGIGDIQALGESTGGIDVDRTGLTGTSGRQEIELRVEVGFGTARVERR